MGSEIDFFLSAFQTQTFQRRAVKESGHLYSFLPRPPTRKHSDIFKKRFRTLWPLFMDVVHLCQGYRATSRRQFTFHHWVPRISWYWFDQTQKDERLSRPLEPSSDFEHRTPWFGIQPLNFASEMTAMIFNYNTRLQGCYLMSFISCWE